MRTEAGTHPLRCVLNCVVNILNARPNYLKFQPLSTIWNGLLQWTELAQVSSDLLRCYYLKHCLWFRFCCCSCCFLHSSYEIYRLSYDMKMSDVQTVWFWLYSFHVSFCLHLSACFFLMYFLYQQQTVLPAPVFVFSSANIVYFINMYLVGGYFLIATGDKDLISYVVYYIDAQIDEFVLIQTLLVLCTLLIGF